MLEKFPRLQKLWPPDMVAKLNVDDHRYNWIHAKAPQAEALRQDLESLLEWADQAGVLDGELLGNLRGRSREQYRAARDELRVARYLAQLAPIKRPEPWADGKRMDWVLCAAPPIYVEVKSLFGEDSIPPRVTNALRRVAREFTTGYILWVEVKVPAPNVTPKKFRAYLKSNLHCLPKCLQTEQQMPDYVDPSGLSLGISCMDVQLDDPTRLVIAWSGGGPITSHKDVRDAVGRAIDQIPDSELGIRALVVVCPHFFPPIDTTELVGAMQSLPRVDLTTGKVTYSLEGVAQPDKYTRVSAIARYDENPQGLEIIHNPFARNPIVPEVLVGLQVRQLTSDGDGTMRWI